MLERAAREICSILESGAPNKEVAALDNVAELNLSDIFFIKKMAGRNDFLLAQKIDAVGNIKIRWVVEPV